MSLTGDWDGRFEGIWTKKWGYDLSHTLYTFSFRFEDENVKVAFRDNFGLSAVTSLRKECVRPKHFRNNTNVLVFKAVHRWLTFIYFITLHKPKKIKKYILKKTITASIYTGGKNPMNHKTIKTEVKAHIVQNFTLQNVHMYHLVVYILYIAVQAKTLY